MKKKRVVFLYTSLNGFLLSTVRALWATEQCEFIDIFHWPSGSTPGNHYEPEPFPGARLHDRKSLTTRQITNFLREVNPDLIYVSGWMDRGYLDALRRLRSQSTAGVTVCGIDDQWYGTLRQRLGRYYFRLRLRKLIDRMWVSGAPQYHYARQFGYVDSEIIYNLLSADATRFKPARVCKRFVFVGRFEPIKGADLLLTAYGQLPQELRQEWPLVLIGQGSMRESLASKAPAETVFIPYLQPADLAKELAKGGVACQPSYRDAWGVSIHELALMGYPVIASSGCGAASEFVIHGHSGLIFRSGDASSLTEAMMHMSRLDTETLQEYGRAGTRLGARISPSTAAYNLLSADASWRGRKQRAG